MKSIHFQFLQVTVNKLHLSVELLSTMMLDLMNLNVGKLHFFSPKMFFPQESMSSGNVDLLEVDR